ncbi:DUF2637 domain-containing protein [Nonomuraea sp. NPDC059007]|uniref:DUF2637 domain-containing protein n=1 Tax=Nonomuraea sp. NPDC059007 TaxID=3346692 RepID=UPI0036B5A509
MSEGRHQQSPMDAEHRVPRRNGGGVRCAPTAGSGSRRPRASLLVALIAAVVSFRHMHELALLHGEDPLAAALLPATVGGTIVAASMSLLPATRYGSRGGLLP